MSVCDECNVAQATTTYENRSYCDACRGLKRECKKCHEVKSIFEFERNQRTPKGAMNRRSECKPCRKTRRGISVKDRSEFERLNPRPTVGDTFGCPVCQRIFTIRNNQSVNLDHDNETGEIRGWICNDCNTGMGKMNDNINTLARAIAWIKSLGRLKFLL